LFLVLPTRLKLTTLSFLVHFKLHYRIVSYADKLMIQWQLNHISKHQICSPT